MHLCDSSNIATGAMHVIWVQSYEVLHGATTIHNNPEMTRLCVVWDAAYCIFSQALKVAHYLKFPIQISFSAMTDWKFSA